MPKFSYSYDAWVLQVNNKLFVTDFFVIYSFIFLGRFWDILRCKKSHTFRTTLSFILEDLACSTDELRKLKKLLS